MLDGSRWFSVDVMVERICSVRRGWVLYQDEKPVDWRAWAQGA
jgi:hypothetical protein